MPTGRIILVVGADACLVRERADTLIAIAVDRLATDRAVEGA
jgi:hypothetical protein